MSSAYEIIFIVWPVFVKDLLVELSIIKGVCLDLFASLQLSLRRQNLTVLFMKMNCALELRPGIMTAEGEELLCGDDVLTDEVFSE